MIAGSKDGSQLSKSDKMSPTSDHANPTKINENKNKRQQGEGLAGVESRAEYMIEKSGRSS